MIRHISEAQAVYFEKPSESTRDRPNKEWEPPESTNHGEFDAAGPRFRDFLGNIARDSLYTSEFAFFPDVVLVIWCVYGRMDVDLHVLHALEFFDVRPD